MIQSLARWLQNAGFLTPALPLYLPVGTWDSTVSNNPPFSLFYLFIPILIFQWSVTVLNCFGAQIVLDVTSRGPWSCFCTLVICPIILLTGGRGGAYFVE